MYNISKELCTAVKSFQRYFYRHSSVNVFINGTPVTVPKHFTVMQALRQERVTIPSFCYHERLSISGNCRMCLIELEGMPKLQIACAINVGKDMKIRTNSPAVLKAQESVLEFLLANHPLDCPICDQGGECDLQDLTMKFGNDRTRFTDHHFSGKRSSIQYDFGPLIRGEMTRCIHCTRCIRFASQVCGVDVLGTTGRGVDMLVGTYVDKPFLSELSGNVIDICPVGSLTSIPYMFKARPWELTRTDSIDVTDATGTNIVVNHRFNRVLRVLPRENDEINQEFISDKARWAIDSLEMQRIVAPMVRTTTGALCAIEWPQALCIAASYIKCGSPSSVVAIAGPHTNVETLVACKDFLNGLGSEHTYVERGLNHSLSGTDLRSAYSLNVSMKDIVNADKILLFGTNPRFEAPMLNAWIRQAYRANECDIYYVGPKTDFNYTVTHLGTDLKSCSSSVLSNAKSPLIFVGVSQLETPQAGEIMKVLYECAKSSKTPVNVIPREASWGGALEAGWKPGALQALHQCNPKVIISLGADDIFYEYTPPCGCAVIYIGFQGDRGAQFSCLALPGSAYTESGGIYLNMECRAQYALPAVSPPGKARHDWKIIRALSEVCGSPLCYNDYYSLCGRMSQISPNLIIMGDYQEKLFGEFVEHLLLQSGQADKGDIDIDMKTLSDFYCSDVFTYNSPTMIKAQKAAIDHAESNYALN